MAQGQCRSPVVSRLRKLVVLLLCFVVLSTIVLHKLFNPKPLISVSSSHSEREQENTYNKRRQANEITNESGNEWENGPTDRKTNNHVVNVLPTHSTEFEGESAQFRTKSKVSKSFIARPGTKSRIWLHSTSKTAATKTHLKDQGLQVPAAQSAASEFSEAVTSLSKRDSKTKDYGTRITRRRDVCAYVGLNGWPVDGMGTLMTATDHYNLSCSPHQSTPQTCRKPFSYFKRYYPSTKVRECADHKKPSSPICTFTTKFRISSDDKVQAKCSSDVCGQSTVHLGCRDTEHGTVDDIEHWKVYENVRDLEQDLPQIVTQNSLHGFCFCFVRCNPTGHETILQSLIFPPLMKTTKHRTSKPININILVEDAVSREHFYRVLPHTVTTLRNIAINASRRSQATVIDFEMVQSFASYTLRNIQYLFAGRKYENSNKATVREPGIEVIVEFLRKFGYQTLIHEDLCWFDFWGGLISPVFKTQKLPYFSTEFKEAFENYTTKTASHIDNRGLSHMACEVLRNLGYTNPFNGKNLPTVCLDGKFMSEYFLNYVMDFVKAAESNEHIAPAFLYTHLNTGHESTGKRIRTDDVILSQFVDNMAQKENTLTVILSDHGGKTTKYATSTLEGNLEIFSPILFMIIPQKVASKLGRKRMEVLKLNEKRLITLLDLHRTLMSVVELSKEPVQDHDISGLFAPIPANRTCSDIPGLSSDAMCRCEGWNKFLSKGDAMVLWLAEYALGQINEMIQRQYMEGAVNESNRYTTGYGACARFVGKKVARPRRKLIGEFFITTMVLVVVPAWGVKSEERFEVVLKHSVTQKDNVTLEQFIRLSFYSPYQSCADKGVDIKLCACAHRKSKRRMPNDIIRTVNRSSFRLEHSLQLLDSECLIVVLRRKKYSVPGKPRGTRILTVEVVNQCNDRTFLLNLGGSYTQATFSQSTPITVTAKPRTINFLVTVYLKWKFGRYNPDIQHTLIYEHRR